MTLNKIDSDTLRLQSLGYKQELSRRFTCLTNYGISLSIISVTSRLMSVLSYGMIIGGPMIMICGWFAVCFFTLLVVLATAELCSAYPTSGGPYYWAGILVPQRHKAMASWFTGWFNLIGQLTATAAVDFSLAVLTANLISLFSNSRWVPEPYHLVLIYCAILLSHGICNSLGTRFLSWLACISAWWQIFAPIMISLALIVYPKPGHQSIEFVLTDFKNESGWKSEIYVILIGLLPAQYVFNGSSAAAHLTEDTKQADKAGPWSMISAVFLSSILGCLFLVALLLGIHDYEATLRTSTGFPIIQILFDNFEKEIVLIFIGLLLIAHWFCGLASITINSRMIYAFSRDHAMVGSHWLKMIFPYVSCPMNAVWLSCFVAFLLALPYLGNPTAYLAITGLSAICFYISYILPMAFKLIYSNAFLRGPFHLGYFSTFINLIALIWMCFMIVLLTLPSVYPITLATMNYSLVGVIIVFFCVLIVYIFSAKYWFQGPLTNLSFAIQRMGLL